MFEIPFGVDLWSKLFWIFVGLLLAGLLGWIVRSLFGGESERTLTVADRLVKVEEPVVTTGDQLEAIEGVGPAVADYLRMKGIYRFEQVAAMRPAEVQALLDGERSRFAMCRPMSWPFQAALLANGQLAGFAAAASRFRAGLVPAEVVDGIGPATQERLAAIDVATVDTLADQNAADLSRRLGETGDSVGEDVVARWIEQARAMMNGDRGPLAAFLGLPAAALGLYRGADVSRTMQLTERRLGEPLTLTAPAAGGFWAGPWWPFVLGLLGLALLALLCALGVWCPVRTATTTTVASTTAVTAPRSLAEVKVEGGQHFDAYNMRLDTDAMFDTDKDTLKPEGQAAINARLDAITAFTPESIVVTGHADRRGDDAYNLELSKRRADSVAAYIREQVTARGINWTAPIEAYGAGEAYPDAAARTAEACAEYEGGPASAEADACFAPDRRVHLTIFARAATAGAEGGAN